MNPARVLARPTADRDVEAAFDGYESQTPDLGLQFLAEIRATYDRIAAGPAKYQLVVTQVRRALLRRFPYAVYFAIENDVAVILAVLHAARDPAKWQRGV
mgnify:CR=1 FL=1